MEVQHQVNQISSDMEKNVHKQLTVTIAGRPYPLKIKANDEPVLRKLVKDVNAKINKFRLAYPSRDMQDCAAIALLTLAVDLHKTRQEKTVVTQSSPEINQKLSSVDALLDTLL